jgi:hypothetical protein
MVVLRFFRLGLEPDSTILGKLEKNLVLKKTQVPQRERLRNHDDPNASAVTRVNVG